ncbi:hypothetical protein [Actinomadura algeriensis]|uniref:DUF998 domain-containing protein n=1 Tax=Actinomadura algeriensis TaxID=1679523 RepID=A0ABR9K2J2_9ACTN|nr:hypothetical protein [Actinomadura algeriensis]MBE1537037.1 hypothetical protein [Actinomadura algeriensis]
MTASPIRFLAAEDEVCPPELDWSFVGAVAAHSQFAGVLAGFVLAVMVVIVALPGNAEKRAKALGLFSAAFFALAVVSVLFGSLAGEQTCMRLHTAGVLSCGLLAVGASLTFAGITWLLEVTIDGPEHRSALRPAAVAAFGTQLTAVLLVTVTVYALVEDLSIGEYWELARPPEWLIWAHVVPTLIVFAIIVRFRSREFSEQATGIRLASYGAMGYTVLTVIVFGVVVSTPGSKWE